jgi:hypothetical protein
MSVPPVDTSTSSILAFVGLLPKSISMGTDIQEVQLASSFVGASLVSAAFDLSSVKPGLNA